MKAKTMLLGVIYSAVAAVIAAFVLQSSAGLAAESFMTAAVIVFIVALVSSLLTSAGGSAASSSAPTIRGAEVVSGDDANDQREGGVVKWFNVTKGFGFITRDQGDDVFVHFRSIRGTGHRSLTEGQRVKFEVVESDKGLQAEDVSVVA